MKKLTIALTVALFAGSIAFFHGCKKDASMPTSTVIISLKDAPAAFDEVNIEVTGIEIHSNVDGWVNIPVTDSIYNLLLLQGNNATFLANAVLASGTISQVRLILGTQNTVSVSGTVYPLLLSSQDETGLKLNIHQELAGGVTYDMVIDFDAAQSVIDEGNGSYRLKPVLTAEFQ